MHWVQTTVILAEQVAWTGRRAWWEGLLAAEGGVEAMAAERHSSGFLQ